MTDKPTRGRPLSPRTLRDMALDDFADGSAQIKAAQRAFVHAARRLAVADTHMVRGYHRIIGAQEYEDRERGPGEKPWDGRERRARVERRQPELGIAA